jgi:predicted TIM-barrel fold metal-dependent hydrolase
MDALGISAAWLLTWYLPPAEDVPESHGAFNPMNMRPDGTQAGITLRDVVEARDRYPDRFVAGYCPCPTEGRAAQLFEAAYRNFGVRVCGEWSYRTLLDDPRSIELFRMAGTLRAPVVLHIDAPFLPVKPSDGVGLAGPAGQVREQYQEYWYGGDMGALERALAACPETIFIGHAPGFWRYISGDAEQDPEKYPSGPITPGGRLFQLLERYPNLWADLSAGSGLTAMRRDPAHARGFLIKYADRLLYGRDDHGDALRQFLATLYLPQDVMERISYMNALRLVPTATP